MTKCHFWADVMLRQARLWASRASLAQKYQAGCEGGLILKTFQGLQFLFPGELIWLIFFELFARETNLRKKRSVGW